MTVDVETLVSKTLRPLDGMTIPETLHQSVLSHQRHLLELASALIAGGQDRGTIERCLETAFASYKTRLLDVIVTLKEQDGPHV